MPPRLTQRKKRRRSSYCRISLKERQRLYDKRYQSKKSKCVSLKRTTSITLPLTTEPQIFCTISTAINIDVNMVDSTPIPDTFSVSSNCNNLQKQNEILQKQLSLAQKDRDRYKKQRDEERKKRIATECDIYALLQDSDIILDDVNRNKHELDQQQYKHKSPLCTEITSNINIITESSFSPDFAAAFYAFIKIRMKCLILRSSKALVHLVQTMNIYNNVIGNGLKPIELGGTSSATLDRLMQFRAEKLFCFETAIITQRKWKQNKSILTLYHDEMSYKQRSTESVIMAFDTEQSPLSHTYFPQLQCGNVVRAIWHREIPSKDALTTVQYAISPAVKQIDTIGSLLYNSEWINLRKQIKQKCAVISDQNTTALKTNEYIQSEFDIDCLYKFICLHHNLDNTLKTVENRLLLDRNDDNTDTILNNCRNIGIIEICNRIQNALMQGIDSNGNKSDLFTSFCYDSPNKKGFVDYHRVIGDRRQHQIHNINASVSRRVEIGDFSKLQSSSKAIVVNSRILYEFSYSSVLLRESIIMINVQRMYIKPLTVTIGRDLRKMKQMLPVLADSFIRLQWIVDDQRYAFKTLLNLSQLLNHKNGSPVVVLSHNKNITKYDALVLTKCLENIDVFTDNNCFDAQKFWENTVEIIKKENKHLFNDKYFYYLICMDQQNIMKIIKGLQGVYQNIITDLRERYKVQETENVPDSVFSNTDCVETLNATGKYYVKKAPNMREGTQSAHGMHDFNKDGWYTWNHDINHDPKTFERNLIIWHSYCKTFRISMKETKERRSVISKIKATKLRIKINGTTIKIPTRKRNIAKSNLKNVISTSFPASDNVIWDYWLKQRDERLRKYKGITMLKQRQELKKLLIFIVKHYKITKRVQDLGNGTGLERLQKGLYAYCREMNANRR